MQRSKQTFACAVCAERLKNYSGWELKPISGVELGICQHGRYIHGDQPLAGTWYTYTTPEQQRAARRRKAREHGQQQRPSGGGERVRAGRGA